MRNPLVAFAQYRWVVPETQPLSCVYASGMSLTEPEPAVADDDVVVSIDVDATPERLWEAITSDEGLASWLGRGARIDPRPDGDIEGPDIATGRPRRGTVDSVLPGQRLAFRWWPVDEPELVTSVTLVVEPGLERTRLTVTERVSTDACLDASAAWQWRTALVAVPLGALVSC